MTARKAIKNYATTLTVAKSLAKIQESLASNGARKVMVDYSETGEPETISFTVMWGQDEVPYRMPAYVEKVHSALRARSIEKKFKTREHAARVAWRILLDWVEAQMARIETETADIGQLFLSYAYDPASEETVYEKFQKRGPALLMSKLEDGKTEEG